MLVTFECRAYANITYFGDVAKQLLAMMGHSGTVPGAIRAEDVPSALARLQDALRKYPDSQPSAPERGGNVDDKDAPVLLRTRALPLIELLNAAVKEECEVMWR